MGGGGNRRTRVRLPAGGDPGEFLGVWWGGARGVWEWRRAGGRWIAHGGAATRKWRGWPPASRREADRFGAGWRRAADGPGCLGGGLGGLCLAIQLAQAAAAMGQRVLLVNADLRKPSLQTLVGEHDRHDLIHGLTDAIVGSAELMDIVRLLPGEENLYILLSGSIALDPTSLLSSKKMRDLMRKCEDNFDLVIYDTVPLNFADSLLLIPHTDGLLMVTRLGKIHREVLRNSLRTLEVSKVAVLGLVVNMISASSSSLEIYRSYGNK